MILLCHTALRVVGVFMILAVVSTIASAVEDQDEFQPGTILAAAQLVGGEIPNAVYKNSQADDGPNYAEIQHLDTGWVITFFPNVMKGTEAFNLIAHGGLNSAYARGVLAGLLLHEHAHACEGTVPTAESDLLSCSHIAIRFGTSMEICSLVAVLRIGPPFPSAEDCQVIKGLCRMYTENQRVLNTPDAVKAIRACQCGPSPYTPPIGCTCISNPPLPPDGCAGTDFFEVLPACEPCSEPCPPE